MGKSVLYFITTNPSGEPVHRSIIPSTSQNENTRLAILFTVAALSGATVHAASISWGTPTNISGDGDVSTSGTLLGAFNVGGLATTVNGVNFQAFGVGAASNTVGNFNLSSSSAIGANSFTTPLTPFSNLSASYPLAHQHRRRQRETADAHPRRPHRGSDLSF